ncbi:hypothetical protein B0H12DRAFT_1074948 [Mycena haematopus]|nr:hypothetical protein B0H12DRAFT_1074948 [Mycena haematopus]
MSGVQRVDSRVRNAYVSRLQFCMHLADADRTKGRQGKGSKSVVKWMSDGQRTKRRLRIPASTRKDRVNETWGPGAGAPCRIAFCCIVSREMGKGGGEWGKSIREEAGYMRASCGDMDFGWIEGRVQKVGRGSVSRQQDGRCAEISAVIVEKGLDGGGQSLSGQPAKAVETSRVRVRVLQVGLKMGWCQSSGADTLRVYQEVSHFQLPQVYTEDLRGGSVVSGEKDKTSPISPSASDIRRFSETISRRHPIRRRLKCPIGGHDARF